MTHRFDLKSMMVGGLLIAALALLAGAVTDGPAAPAGRFSMVTTANRAFLLDTATGQVWVASGTISSDSEQVFKAAKLGSETAPIATAATGQGRRFAGQWKATRPNEDDLNLRIDPDGRCSAMDDDRTHKGSWRIEGERIIITIDDEAVQGELGADGRLVLWEEDGDERIAFVRVQ
jgi:hypothetical protein